MSENAENADVVNSVKNENLYDVSDYEIAVMEEVNPATVVDKRLGKFRQRKRPAEEDTAEIQIKRIRQRIFQRIPEIQHGGTSAVALLNEYQLIDKELKYEMVSCTAEQSQTPMFHVRYTHNNQVFEGTASTKKKAKQIAAEAVLRALFDVPAVAADAVDPSDGNDLLPQHSSTSVMTRLRPGTSYENHGLEVVNPEGDDGELQEFAQYRVSCVVDGVTFVGVGFSQKVARLRAAADALENVFGISCTETKPGKPVFIGELSSIPINDVKSRPKPAEQKPEIVLPQLLCTLPGQKHPLMMLHELYPTAEYAVTLEDGVFHTTVPIEDKTFEGLGTTKKVSRHAAAILALNYLHQTGHLQMRLAEKNNSKKPKWQPPQRTSFSLESNGNYRGGRTGRGRGFKPVISTDSAKDASWVSGGILKAGDFLGLKSLGANSSQVGNKQNYQLATDASSYMTGSSGFGFGNSYGIQQHGNYEMGCSTPGGVQESSSYAFDPAVASGSFGSQSRMVRRGIGSVLRGSRGTTRGVAGALGSKGRGIRSVSQFGSSIAGGLQYNSDANQLALVGIRKVQPKTGGAAVGVASAAVKRLMDMSAGCNLNSGMGFGSGKSHVLGNRQSSSVNSIAGNPKQVPFAGNYSAETADTEQSSTAAFYPDYSYTDYGLEHDGSRDQSAAYLGFSQADQNQLVEYPSYEQYYGEQYDEGGYTM